MDLFDIRLKYYPDIDEYVFFDIVHIDPTYRSDRPGKRGRYAAWLLSLYGKGNLKIEDADKAHSYLAAFDAHKRHIERNDISQYRTLPELYGAVKPYIESHGSALSDTDLSHSQIKRNGAEKVYEDDEWVIVMLKTFDASRLYGSHTQWCTTSSKCYFNSYISKGPLYININRKTGHKFQMHFISRTRRFSICCDERDAAVHPGDIGLSPGAADYYDSNWDTAYHIAYCDHMEIFATGITSRNIYLRSDALHAHPLIPGRLVEYPVSTCGHMMCRSSDGNYYYVAKDGTRVDTHGLKTTVDSPMRNGIITQYDPQKGWYCIDRQSNVTMLPKHDLNRRDYNVCGPFVLGRALVRDYYGSLNYIDKSGRLVFTQCFNDATDFSTNGTARVNTSLSKEPRYQFVDIMGNILPGRYLKCNDFSLGVAAVRTLDGLWNFVTASGDLLLRKGVDYCSDFDPATGLAKIHSYRGDNYINVDGQLLYPNWRKPK